MNTIDQKIDHLIGLTARVESGGRYDAWNPNDNGHGPSFGLIQFNATVGSLGRLLRLMAARAPGWFRIVFGCMPGDFEAFAREIAADPEFYEARLKLSGQVPIWQQCQRQLAQEEYFNPAAKLCAKFGLVSERAHAMAFDVAVQYGVGGLGKMLSKTLGLTYDPVVENGFERHQLNWLAEWADTHEYDANRRHKLLANPELSDAPLFDVCRTCDGSGVVECGDPATGEPISEPCPDCYPPKPQPAETRPTLRALSYGPDVLILRDALESAGYPTNKPTSPAFTYALGETVKAFQAAHGLAADGIAGPATWAALDQAAKEGGGKA